MKNLLLIFFGLSGIVLAQLYNFHYYNSSNGLINTSITSITQDHQGYIWIGTSSNLFRYSGYNFDEIGGWDNSLRTEITGIATTNNQVWIATSSKGIFVVKKDKEIIHLNDKLQFLPKKIKKIRKEINRLLFITQNDEFFVAHSDSQVTRILSDAILPATSFNDIVAIDNGYAIASDEGLLIFQYNRVKYTFNQNKAGKTFQAKAVTLDKNKNIIFLTNTGSIYRIENYQLQEIHSNNNVYTSFSLIVDMTNAIWAGLDDGILRIEKDRKEYIGFGNGLPHQFVTELFEDREGNIWIGTLNGVAKLNSLAIKNYPSLFPKVTSSVHKILKGNKEILVFTDEGISVFNANNKTFINTQISLHKRYHVHDVIELPNSNKLVATNDGLFTIERNKLIPSALNSQIKSRKILSLAYDYDNKIYVGTDSGLYIFQGNKLYDYYSIDDVLPGNEINAIQVTKSGDVYVGTDNGLVKLSDKSILVLRTSNGLINNYVTSLLEDNEKRIWIGTKKGLSSFKNGRFNNFTPKFGGVTVDEILDVIAVGNDEIWLATSKGVFIIKNGVQYSAFTSKDGILSDFVTNLEYDKQNGIVFIGTNSGLTTIELKYLKRNTFSYQIFFTGFATNKRTYNLDDIKISEDEENLSIYVSIFSFFDEKRIIYRYRIKEIEDNWNYITNSNLINYKKLSPGDYTLAVEASVDGINWLKNSAELKFSVSSSLIKKLVYVVSALLFLTFIYSVFLFIKNQVKSRNQKISSPVSKKPETDEIKNILSSEQENLSIIETDEFKKKVEEKIESLKQIILEKEKVIEKLLIENKELKEQIQQLESGLSHKEDESEFVEKSSIEIIVRNSKEAEEIKKYVEALEKTNWNIRAAAKLLNIPHSTFHYRLKKLNLLKSK